MSPDTTLARALYQRLRVLSTTLRPSTLAQYRLTAKDFLRYLQAHFPSLRRPDQLRRDPHIAGWMVELARRTPPLSDDLRGRRLMHLRRLLEDLADLPHPPRPGLIHAEDLPRRPFRLPRPLTVDDDQRLSQQLRLDNSLPANALLLQRAAGLRIGELVNLALDCLQHIGGDHWAIRVPATKGLAERWVPADQELRDIVARLHFLRTLVPGGTQEPFLIPRGGDRLRLLALLRHTLDRNAQAAGCSIRPVSHQLRHTYATHMLRSGVSLIGVMKLLGHNSPHITLQYVQVTQADLQREFHQARQHPRHLLPPLPASWQPLGASSWAEALEATLRLLDADRHKRPSPQLDTFRRRLVKLIAAAKKISSQENG
jgi:site-specific recombinase XerD